MSETKEKINYVFFGSSDFAIYVLEELMRSDIVPDLIVTVPAKPKGRKLILTPSPIKIWADKHNIKSIEPRNLKNSTEIEPLKKTNWDLFVVASYGKILPKEIIDLPKHGSINVHPSLLPKLRGPAPIEYTILGDMKETGVTIMKIDEEVDHGPIISSEHLTISPWPMDRVTLEKVLGEFGGKLLAKTIHPWVNGEIEAKEQNHSQATFTEKIEKQDGLINLEDDPYRNFLKIKAFRDWPKTYYFEENQKGKTRLTVTDAELKSDGSLSILKVIPEGKKEMPYSDYKRGH